MGDVLRRVRSRGGEVNDDHADDKRTARKCSAARPPGSARRWLARSIAALLLLHANAGAWQVEREVRAEETKLRSYDGREMSAELLRLTVPERRARPERTLTVAALRLPTTAEEPGRPIAFLMGGPGIPGTAMAPIPPYFSLFQRLRELGDVLIVDQRGVGRSDPVLDCDLERTPPASAFLDPGQLVAFFRAEATACADRWRAQGVEPTAYNTLESADDLDDLRAVLGIEQLDLLAFSYGTRLALAFVQRHGAHVGRVVLQGINGPGLVLKRPAPVARKLQRLGALLERDSTWHGAADLLAAARAARERLAHDPASVTVSDRRSGKPTELQVSREGFDALVGLNLDDARLPALLVSVAEG